MSRLLADRISNSSNNGPFSAEKGINIPLNKPLQINGDPGVIGSYLMSTGSGISWEEFPPVFSGDYNDLINIPINLSQFNNDVGFTTFSNDYNELINTPINLSQFNNDVGFITSFTNYWEKNEIGIYSLSNVGIGTTNPNTSFQVGKDVRIDAITGVVSATKYYGDGSNLTGIVIPRQRTTLSFKSDQIPSGLSQNINITGFKSYSLFKVSVSSASWLRIYTDDNSRNLDSDRLMGVDPSLDSGVIAEIISIGSTTISMSPAIIGWNNDTPVNSNIYIRVDNLGQQSAEIEVSLNVLKLED